MDEHDRLVAALKDIIVLFSLMAAVGSFYHGAWLAGCGYSGLALLFFNEKQLRRWWRGRRGRR
ncbi:hypothetical protein ABZN20_10765 [Methylococcus sp. ANG]|uniref:hypothetical protein n=1 Tax=unclassified Methylococcus TaxID=2618889 RepID=UPI001C529729|nr:hypothetical protein [Methylococcus sp. Mc7]QXP84852.1 hypothetical protein KW115_03690 [Methylococcus sp. Mc7]